MSPQRAPTASLALADWPAAWGIERAQGLAETAGCLIWRVWRRDKASPRIVNVLKDRSDAAHPRAASPRCLCDFSADWFAEQGEAASARATLDTQYVLQTVLDDAAAT